MKAQKSRIQSLTVDMLEGSGHVFSAVGTVVHAVSFGLVAEFSLRYVQ